MPCLYVNTKGTPWRKHSYSAGNDFDLSPYKYYLRRVLGWKEKDNQAKFLFGHAMESAVQFYHEHGGTGIREEFARLWGAFKNRTDLKYTKTEKDWQTLALDGDELLRLYTIRQPSLPMPIGGQIVFQREITKEVFPGDKNYGEIEDAGKLDVIAWVDPHHPLLPKIEWKPEYGMLRAIIIDIKCMGKSLPEEAGITAFDDQLRRYSWLSGIHDVALLGFIKVGRTLKKGNSVTLLEAAGSYKAGDEAVIAAIEGDHAWLVKNDYMLEEMDRVQGEKKDKNGNDKKDQTKAAKERAAIWRTVNAVCCSTTAITRQRIQFNAGFVTSDSQRDAGQICANQIVGIVNAWKTKKWPNRFGIRFPHDNRNDPYFQAFVLGDEAFRQENFVKSDEETMEDLFADDQSEEE